MPSLQRDAPRHRRSPPAVGLKQAHPHAGQRSQPRPRGSGLAATALPSPPVHVSHSSHRIALAAMHKLLINHVKDPSNGYRAFSATALKKLDTEFDPSYGVEIEINKTLKHLKKTYVDTTITYGERTSKQNFVTQGLNLAWTIAWVWLTTNPTTTATLGIMSMATSVALFIHTSIIFNTTRYIRLTYTALSLILETVAMILIAIAITTILTRK